MAYNNNNKATEREKVFYGTLLISWNKSIVEWVLNWFQQVTVTTQTLYRDMSPGVTTTTKPSAAFC